MTVPKLLKLLLAACLLVSTLPLAAAEAVVVHKSNLRKDPSATNKPIQALDPDEVLELINPNPTDSGYYHVKTDEGARGYVYERGVKIVESSASAPSARPATARAATPDVSPGGPASSIPKNWDKPAPQTAAFHGTDGVCPAAGEAGGDTETNTRKNRTDIPSEYHAVTWTAIADLAYPVAGKTLDKWTAPQKAQIAPYQGVAVSTVGYLVAIKPQTGSSGESTNCHFHAASEVDWHVALVQNAGDEEKTSVVVETTPRVRASHPKWTPTALAQWLTNGKPVRISGWLMIDPEHRNHLGKYRSTLWEVHPIIKIEVMKDGTWVDLDTL